MSKISIATGDLQARYGDRETLRIAKECGADAVDFSFENFCGRYDYRNPTSVYALPEEEFRAYFTDLRQYAEELGIFICQTHGRGPGFRNIKSEDDALIENARLDCLATSLLGAPTCIIHAVTTMFHMDAEPQFMRDLNFDMFMRILPYAKQYGVKIATETFGDVHGGVCCDFFGNIGEFIDSYERVASIGDNRDHFTVCVDTGHTNKATKFNQNPAVPDVIRQLGNRVTALHINDNNTVSDQHLIPYIVPVEGSINWKETFAALKEIGYQGIYNLELSLNRYGDEILPETTAFAITVLRNALKKYGMDT